MARKIIIDTDPGKDDAVALLLALASPQELEVVGIVAVAGNVGLARNASNALKVVELSGRLDVPVYAGCERPIRRTLVTAEHIHGKTGLDGAELPEPSLGLRPGHGVDYLIETLSANDPGSITLCTLGPLTNIAMALIKAPAIAPRIAEIVMMAGACFEGGNVRPCAEFNVFVDPEAADIVLSSGIRITMVPLDATHGVLSTHARLDRIAALGNRCGRTVNELLRFAERSEPDRYRAAGAPLHDPCVIAYLLAPGLFQGRTINVTVETMSELTMGMTVVDYWGVTDRVPNVHYLRHADADGFFELLTERLGRLP